MTNSPLLNSYHPDLVVEAADNGWRIVRLNRPKSLHALDESIVSALLKAFEDFQHDDQVKAIWLDSTTPKAFCAGGDVRKLRQLVINHEVDTANRFLNRNTHWIYSFIIMPNQFWSGEKVMLWEVGWACLWQHRSGWSLPIRG